MSTAVVEMMLRKLTDMDSTRHSGMSSNVCRSNGWPDVNFKDVEGLARLTSVFHGLTTVAIDRSGTELSVLICSP